MTDLDLVVVLDLDEPLPVRPAEIQLLADLLPELIKDLQLRAEALEE